MEHSRVKRVLFPSLFLFAILIIIINCLTKCGNKNNQLASQEIQTLLEPESRMTNQIKFTSLSLDKSFYLPGELVHVSLEIDSKVEDQLPVHLNFIIRHLNDLVNEIDKNITLSKGIQVIDITYKPPEESPRGYGIDLCIKSSDNLILACDSISFDVLEHWTQSPRYGFLTDFFPERSDYSETMDFLTRFHINGIQFYDWMFRHDNFLTEHDPYLDPLGRQLSLETVKNLISAAHISNIDTMAYTAIYAASIPFYNQHPEWALYKADKTPYYLGDNFLVYMDPRPNSPWIIYLLDQFLKILEETDFNGIHLDQYGDPKEAYDYQGNRFNLDRPLAETINATKSLVLSKRPNGAVVFNAVTNWPIETVAPSNADIVYIEVWPPYRWFGDLHNLIREAQSIVEKKPVVLAAYLDPSFEHNVRLVDAVIFASGGSHIELGEIEGMLSEAYFPRYKVMSPDLLSAIRRYYDFSVRYQDVIGPRAKDSTKSYLHKIEVGDVSVSPSLSNNKVWPIVRESKDFTAISLINLLGIESPEWTDLISNPPTPLGETTVRIKEIDHDIKRIWFSTPDSEDLYPQDLVYEINEEEGSRIIAFKIPGLQYWDLIVIEWQD